LGKISDSQGSILVKFAEKPEPNPVAYIKMMSSADDDMPEEVDYSNTYT
jgi:hypothetical protein